MCKQIRTGTRPTPATRGRIIAGFYPAVVYAARLAALSVVSLAIGVGCGGGGSHSPQVPTTPATPPAEISQHWSGYMVTARRVSFRHVTGTWTVPAAICTARDAGAYSTVWVGLGGYTPGTQTLEQVGTDSNCDASGEPLYFAWFELLPDVSHTIELKVTAGDTITGSVKLLGSNRVELQVQNRTRHWTWTRKLPASVVDGSSAEWIVEAPYACENGRCRQAPLTNFGSVRIHDIAAVGNGFSGTLANPAWKRTELHFLPCTRRSDFGLPTSRAAAKPRKIATDGTQFKISWIRDIGPTPSCRRRSTPETPQPPQPGGLPA